ncbi:MAG: heavy metal-responsive transcriptional regulator [Bacteroidetes bacterium]|nr:MAG: heavy metal-responsive transcriptional regulator [Bacteroidota bacterium]
MSEMTIGQVAKRTGVNIQTVRFYERKGLVLPEKRTDSGYRIYSHEAVRRIRFVRHAQEMGFSLREIEDLLSLRIDPGMTCADVKIRAETKRTEVEQKIDKLSHMQRALEMLVARCDGDGPVSECPIIEALDSVNDGLT